MIILVEIPIATFKAILHIKNNSIFYFRFDIEDTDKNTYKCNETIVKVKNATYETMVSSLIEVKYSLDAQLALLYNYQLDSEAYAQAMQEYQDWRAYCKESARDYFNIEKDNNTIDNNYTEEESGE